MSDADVRSRVPAGVRTGGQFATEARAEAPVELARLAADIDPLEGACWRVPDGVDRTVALEVDVPLAAVDWWTVAPTDGKRWCACGACPTTPTLSTKDPDDFDDWDLRCDGRLIAHYAACMERGDEFPPVQVLHDPAGQPWGGTLHRVLVDDGFHRLSAARMLGLDTVRAHVFAADHGAALAAIAPPP